jgi:hypothetical protein
LGLGFEVLNYGALFCIFENASLLSLPLTESKWMQSKIDYNLPLSNPGWMDKLSWTIVRISMKLNKQSLIGEHV